MKILLTGMNKGQCTKDFYLRQQLKVVPSHYSLIRCLQDMGHDVVQRQVELGEDLSSYDKVIFYMHSPQSFCQNLYTGLYTLSQRPDAIIAFDDWQVDQIYNGITGFATQLMNEPEKAFRDYLINLQDHDYTIEDYKKYQSNYIAGCQIILNKQNPLLVSAFDGGNLDLLNLGWKEDRIFRFNPNPYHLNRRPDNNFMSGVNTLFGSYVTPEEKKKEWNFASLLHNKTKRWLKDLNINWDINYYGQAKGEHKSERLTEDEMCRVFSQQWGCLMPGYFHSGSGWWRARPLQVADAGSILLCDTSEGEVYGEAFMGIKADWVEKHTISELTQLAKDQRDCLYDMHPLNRGVERQEIQAVLDA